MSPRKVAEKPRKRWGKALYIAPNRPGGSTSASSGKAAAGPAHPNYQIEPDEAHPSLPCR
jgi:hypothetical protein